MKTLITALLVATAALAQPVPVATMDRYFYSGSNVAYICTTNQSQDDPTSRTRAASTLTSIAVSSNVGTVTTSTDHGLYIGARVVVSGATVDADLNGVYVVATIPSSTTYTIATASVADATYNEATLVVSTTSVLLTSPKWKIKVFKYDTSGNLDGTSWANASQAMVMACSDRTRY